jgi:hypothetical protein
MESDKYEHEDNVRLLDELLARSWEAKTDNTKRIISNLRQSIRRYEA